MEERKIARLFTVTLILKTVQGFLETIAGAFLLFVSADSIASFVIRMSENELAENPGSGIIQHFLETLTHISINGTIFAAVYLLAHGIIKLFLIIGVVHKKLWAYYVFEIVVAIFILYGLHRFTNTHSIFLLVITVFDIGVFWLVWHEAQRLKHHLPVIISIADEPK